MNCLTIFCIGAMLAIRLNEGFAAPLESDPTISIRQKFNATADFKKRLQDILPEEYMNDKFFVSNYLRKFNYDVPTAYQNMEEYVKWFKLEDIANILDNDWDDMRDTFRYQLDGRDKEGRPILYQNLEEWDICGYLAKGGDTAAKRFGRYLIAMTEDAEALVRQLRGEGKEVYTYRYIINAAGFNSDDHGCSECIRLHLERAKLSTFVASNMQNLVILNVRQSLKNILSRFSEYNSDITIYGEDREVWVDALLEDIDLDSLPDSILDYDY